MKPLTKPCKGIYFWIKGLLFHLNWAKTCMWALDEGDKRTIYLIGVHLTKKQGEKGMLYYASVYILPLKVMIGFKW